MIKKVVLTGVMALASVTSAAAQDARRPANSAAAAYDRVPADAVMSEAILPSDRLEAAIARRSPGGNAKELAARIRQDPCSDAEAFRICNYYGPATIRKLRTATWTNAAAGAAMGDCYGPRGCGPHFNMHVSQLLEVGAVRSLQAHYGDKGASEAAEARLDGAADRNLKLGDWKMTSGFGCASDIHDINFGILSGVMLPTHKLTTCRAYLSIRMSFWILAVESAAEASHSRFARKIFGPMFVPTPANSISAQSKLNGTGPAPSNAGTWYSPVSLNVLAVAGVNPPPITIQAEGKANHPGLGSTGNFQVSM